MTEPNTHARLLTIQDLSRLFAVTPRTIRHWAENGFLPEPIRIGRRCMRWTRESIEQLTKKAA